MALRAKDIAEMLGVSTATVSLVLNNKPGVGEQKRQEIIQKIKDLNCEYMLKDVAVNKGNVGFVVYKRCGRIVDESPFFTYILEGINSRINNYGYNLNFIYLNKDMTPEAQRMQLMSANCKGLIIFGVEMQHEDLQVFKDSGLPFSVLDNSFQENDVDSVAINNMLGTAKAIQYLYDMGHREIGYVRSKVRINSFDERYQVYKQQLKKLGLEYNKGFVMDVGYSEIEARRDTREYLKKSVGLPTAFFVENDFLACSVMQEMTELGYRVPEDVSVIGFDNRPISQMVQPKITTINVPKDIFGPAAVDLLMTRMKSGREQSLKIEIGTDLIVRDSVKRIER